MSGEETVDDMPVGREGGGFDDQQSDLAETVESLIEIERQVFAFSERTGFVARSSAQCRGCLLYTSPSPRDCIVSRMPSSA